MSKAMQSKSGGKGGITGSWSFAVYIGLHLAVLKLKQRSGLAMLVSRPSRVFKASLLIKDIRDSRERNKSRIFWNI